MMSEATKLKIKLNPSVGAFVRMFGDALAKELPPAHAKGGQKFLRELKEFEQEAKEVLHGTRSVLSISLQGIEKQVGDAKKELQLLDGLIAALRKHHRDA